MQVLLNAQDWSMIVYTWRDGTGDYPAGYQRFFSRAKGNLIETRNRAWKASGTQGNWRLTHC